MAITVAGNGAAANGTTSLSVAYPTSIAANNLLVLAIVNKYPSNAPSTPAGWTLGPRTTGGSGANTSDSGQIYCSFFYKVATGSESGSLAVTITSGNESVGRMWRLSSGSGAWDVAGTTGTDSTSYSGQTTQTVGADSNPGLTAGDVLIVCGGSNTDTQTFSAEAVTASGISAWGTVSAFGSAASLGDFAYLDVSFHPVTTGTASGAPTYTATMSAAWFANHGGAAFLRVREQTGAINGTATISFSATATPELNAQGRFELRASGNLQSTSEPVGLFFRQFPGLPISAELLTGRTNAGVVSNNELWPLAPAGGASAISGTSSFLFTGAGTVRGAGALGGAAALTFSPNGTLGGAGALSGTSTIVLTPTGSIKASGALGGTSAVTLGASATLVGAGALGGSAPITFSPAGTIAGAGALAGSSFVTLSGVGTLAGAGSLSGGATITFAPSGQLAGAGALGGSGTIVFGATGTLGGGAPGAMSGTSALVFATSATLKGAGALSAASAVSITTTAALAGSGALLGQAAFVLAPTGTIAGAGSINGAASCTMAASAVLVGAGALTGTTPLVVSSSGTLLGAGALSGSAFITFESTATFQGSPVDALIAWTYRSALAIFVTLTPAVEVSIAQTPALAITTEMTSMPLNIGDTNDVDGEFRDGHTKELIDPTTVQIEVKSPWQARTGASTVYAYGVDALLTRSALGKYRAAIPCTESGRWTFTWRCSGPGGAESGQFDVESP